MAKQALLTQLAVDKVKARGPRDNRRVGGIPNLYLRISEDGRKTYSLRYRLPDGRQPRMTLGTHPVMSLAAAKTAAVAALEMAARGEDPAAAKAEAKRARDENSVAAVVAQYVARHARPKLRRWRDVERMLELDVVPAWGERPLASIAKRDVIRLVERVVDRGAPVSANRLLALIQRVFNWAIARGIVETNPAAGIDMPHRERPRARTLTELELRAVWPAFDAIGYPFGVLGQLLLLTAQRRGEIAGMRWDQLDLERALWTLPPAATKTEVEHIVPLVPAAVALLEAVPRIEGSPLVFPSLRRTSARPISGFAKPLAAVQRLSGTSGWTWHDLRRTCRTNLGRLGVEPHIGERILNHAVGSDVARIYDLHRYEAQMRQALELWLHELDRLVRGGERKVVALAGRRA
jgi:integrase